MLCIAVLAGSALAAQGVAQGVATAALFAYDVAQPLDVRSTVLEEPAGAVVHDVSYTSPKGGRVTALLVTPRGPGPHAAVLFGHWGGGDRAEFLPEAILYARAGVVSLLPSYPWTRPAPWRRSLRYSSGPEHDFELYVQAVVDLRRGIDLLTGRPDVDASRLAYVGHSYGAQWGAILAAVDRRMKAAVLAGGVPDLEAIYRESDDPDYVELRTTDPKRVDRLLAVMQSLAAVRYVGQAAPMPLLFQFAKYEQGFPKSAMERYYAAAREPKEIRWYPTAHDLNDPQAIVDRAAWLRTRIGMGVVALPSAPEPPR
jgi:cephalosporin-C deacetylase-like acetyl esterase